MKKIVELARLNPKCRKSVLAIFYGFIFGGNILLLNPGVEI